MAVDMLRAQEMEKTAGPAAGGPGLGMVASTTTSSAALTGIAALEHSAEQEALLRAGGAVGDKKRKLVHNLGEEEGDGEEEDCGGPVRKQQVRDADEIDI